MTPSLDVWERACRASQIRADRQRLAEQRRQGDLLVFCVAALLALAALALLALELA